MMQSKFGGAAIASQFGGTPVDDEDSFSTTDKALGALPTILSTALADPISGLAEVITTARPSKNSEEGRQVGESVRDLLTIDPNRAGAQGLQQAAAAIKNAAEFTNADDAARFIGENFEAYEGLLRDISLEMGASPELAGFVASIPSSVLEVSSVISGGTIAKQTGSAAIRATEEGGKAAKRAASKVVDAVPDAVQSTVDTGKRVANAVQSKATDIAQASPHRRRAAVGLEANDKRSLGFTRDSANRVVPDIRERKALDSGIPEDIVFRWKSAEEATRNKMRDMVSIATVNARSPLRQDKKRAGAVVGGEITKRLSAIRTANRRAGTRIDAEAKRLKGKSVDSAPAINQFLSDLDGIGVNYDPKTNKIDFSRSDIRELKGSEQAIARVISQLRTATTKDSFSDPDAFQLHRMKRILDKQIAYGKRLSDTPLTPDTEFIIRRLRANIDQALDNNFPAYDKANQDYAKTISVLRNMQDAAGKKIDLEAPNADEALGTLSRRILSNATSRQELINALDAVDNVAREVTSAGRFPVKLEDVQNLSPAKFKEDLGQLTGMAIDLETAFNIDGKTTFKGLIEQAVDATPNTGPVTAAAKAVKDSLSPKTAGGKELDEKINALKELVKK